MAKKLVEPEPQTALNRCSPLNEMQENQSHGVLTCDTKRNKLLEQGRARIKNMNNNLIGFHQILLDYSFIYGRASFEAAKMRR